jgi:hypothetical protein
VAQLQREVSQQLEAQLRSRESSSKTLQTINSEIDDLVHQLYGQQQQRHQ